jgi:four helix bundle protein
MKSKTGRWEMLHEKLEAYRRSIGLAEELRKEAATWPRGMGYLSDQLRRAMASCALNTAEGNGRRNTAERRRFFEIARASLAEVGACVDLARAFGLTAGARAEGLKGELHRISRMLWRLGNPATP